MLSRSGLCWSSESDRKLWLAAAIAFQIVQYCFGLPWPARRFGRSSAITRTVSAFIELSKDFFRKSQAAGGRSLHPCHLTYSLSSPVTLWVLHWPSEAAELFLPAQYFCYGNTLPFPRDHEWCCVCRMDWPTTVGISDWVVSELILTTRFGTIWFCRRTHHIGFLAHHFPRGAIDTFVPRDCPTQVPRLCRIVFCQLWFTRFPALVV